MYKFKLFHIKGRNEETVLDNQMVGYRDRTDRSSRMSVPDRDSWREFRAGQMRREFRAGQTRRDISEGMFNAGGRLVSGEGSYVLCHLHRQLAINLPPLAPVIR